MYPLDRCRPQADQGHKESMIDFSICMLAGIDSEPNIAQACSYLKKIISSDADNKFKAMAHALILRSTFAGPQTIPQTFSGMVKAVFHTNEAKRALAWEAPPWFFILEKRRKTRRKSIQQPLRNKTYLWGAVRARDEKFAGKEEMLRKKREAKSNSKSVLKHCGGPCKKAFMPACYSPECQQLNWKVHKHNCKSTSSDRVQPKDSFSEPFGEVEIISGLTLGTKPSGSARISLPIQLPTGGVIYASAALDALGLLKLKDLQSKLRAAWQHR
ncbi:hypothetical protein BD779DRAFT_1669711 [Infundibulicybe gibba]|nr:hypothetical protein BD779DRAFT_1669711 [Infundibulicybe gibba]